MKRVTRSENARVMNEAPYNDPLLCKRIIESLEEYTGHGYCRTCFEVDNEGDAEKCDDCTQMTCHDCAEKCSDCDDPTFCPTCAPVHAGCALCNSRLCYNCGTDTSDTGDFVCEACFDEWKESRSKRARMEGVNE